MARRAELQGSTAAAFAPAAVRGADGPGAPGADVAARFQQQLAAATMQGLSMDPNGGDPAGSASALLRDPYAAMQAGGLSTQAGMLQQLQPAVAPVAPANVTGKIRDLDPELLGRLDRLGAQLGVKVDVISGNRTTQEQAALYQKYLNGTGNLAAPPGSSNHEHGAAADAYVNGVALANVPGAREAAKQLGLHFPVGGEAWHVERSDR